MQELKFNKWFYSWSKKFENCFYIKPCGAGGKFTDDEVNQLKEWLLSLGYKLDIDCKNTIINVIIGNYRFDTYIDVDKKLNDNCYFKFDVEEKRRLEESERDRKSSLSRKIKARPSYDWIKNVYGLKGVNDYNINALQDYIEGKTTEFRGMVNRKWEEPSMKIGAVDNNVISLQRIKEVYDMAERSKFTDDLIKIAENEK